VKITVLSHNLSTNAAMRAYRVALAARRFAEVTLAGPVERIGLWDALPAEAWIRTVTERRLPKFARNFLELVAAADGDVLIAVKPHLASFGAALVAAEHRGVPVVLDMDDLDVALAPREEWEANPEMADPSRPASPVYVSLLTRARGCLCDHRLFHRSTAPLRRDAPSAWFLDRRVQPGSGRSRRCPR
jgi:hypothetical protein